MSLISLHAVDLNIANNVILQGVDWQIPNKARIALVGRNGAGKSTVLKLLQGELHPDRGQLQKQQGLRVAGLAQDVPLDEKATVFEVLMHGLGAVGKILLALHAHQQNDEFDDIAECHQRLDDLQAWDSLSRVETIASKLGIPLNAIMHDLSGGMKRRVLLAAAIVTMPDLLLLDEPTNHLDLPAIEWLESFLITYPGTVILVTHDRAFLSNVANNIASLDRGRLRFYDCDYETFLDRREAFRLAEQKQDALFDKRLADEEVWIRTGVKARRTRNEGRVRALKAMREEHQQRRAQQGQVSTLQLEASRSGTVVIEAKHLNYSIADKSIIQDFSILVNRGEKIGIIGPNGCGKTTLVRLLLGELAPDSGHVRQGSSLTVAYFDQLRRQLEPNKTVMANVADGADHVMIQGKAKHVASYLNDFLFSPEQFNQPVSVLSGGECNRLLLAKLLAKPANFLVMDEPTNDLDIETLELLETMLVDYPGTLLLISHDRAFINDVVTSVLVYEDDQRFHQYVGGYDDYQRYKSTIQRTAKDTSKVKESAPRALSTNTSTVKLTFNEQRELAKLPQKIENLEQQIQMLQEAMLAPNFYQQSAAEISRFNQHLKEQEEALSKMYQLWEGLESRK